MVVYANPSVRQLNLFPADDNGKPTGTGISLMGTDEYNVFLNEPTGLGLSNEIKTADLGYGFFHDLNNTHFKAETIDGDLLFLPDNAYANYRKFINQIHKIERFVLSYQPYNSSETYYCQVGFESLQKEELEQTGVLTVPVSFTPFTPWYLPTEKKLSLYPLSGNELKYNDPSATEEIGYKWYDEIASYGSEMIGTYEGEIGLGGHIPGAITLEYDGLMANPIITLTGVSGKEYGRCVIEKEIQGLRYSSRYLDSYINEIINLCPPIYKRTADRHPPFNDWAFGYIQSDGTLNPNGGEETQTYTSPYISIIPSTPYSFSFTLTEDLVDEQEYWVAMCFYNSSGEKVGDLISRSSTSEQKIYSILGESPSGAALVRISLRTYGLISTIRFENASEMGWSQGYMSSNSWDEGDIVPIPGSSIQTLTSPFIPVSPGSTYTFSCGLTGQIPSGLQAWRIIYFFNSDYEKIGIQYGGITEDNNQVLTVTAPSGASFMRVSFRTFGICEYAQLESGNYPSEYNPNGISVLSFVDPMSDPYIRVPTTEDSIINIQAINELSQEAKITIYQFYRSV